MSSLRPRQLRAADSYFQRRRNGLPPLLVQLLALAAASRKMQ